jgi:hypothetical protein
MISIECPWCTASATVDIVESARFHCAACAIEVEIAPDPVTEPVALAA